MDLASVNYLGSDVQAVALGGSNASLGYKPSPSGTEEVSPQTTHIMTTQTHIRQDGGQELSKDELFHLLSNERRRDILKYLNEHGGSVDMRDLAEWIAARENDTTVSRLRSKERQRVYIGLYQSHLPKLDDHNVIEYNQSRGIVGRTDLADQLDPYLDTETDDAPDEREGERSTSHTVDQPNRPSIRYGHGVIAAGSLTLATGWLGLLSPIVLLALTWIAVFIALSRPQSTGLITGTPLFER